VNAALSWLESLLVLAGLLSPLMLPMLYFLLYRPKRRDGLASPIDSLDARAARPSFFQRWHCGLKVACLLATCFLFISPRGLAVCLADVAIALLATALSRPSWRRVLARLAAMSGFLTMLLLMLPFSGAVQAGEPTYSLAFLPDSLPLRLSGLGAATLIILKATAVALLMEPMLSTATLADTLHGFRQLGVPASLTQMLLLCHRYIFVFQHEAARMWRGMRLRGFVAGANAASLFAIGNFLGMLFVRSFERTQRVYEAMLCRGFTGEMPRAAAPPMTARDALKALFWLALAVSPLVTEMYFADFMRFLGE
jgi:cobalt/nickel transport system permease protein